MVNAREIWADIASEAGLDPRFPASGGAAEVAERILGDGVIYGVPRGPGFARAFMFKGCTRIAVNRSAPIEEVNFAIAEVTAGLLLDERGWFTALPEVERSSLRRRVAANIVAPWDAYLEAMNRSPLSSLPSTFVITWTAAMVRVGEVLPESGSIVTTPAQVYRRGKLLEWATDADVRRLSRNRRATSVTRIPLPDNAGRVALLKAS